MELLKLKKICLTYGFPYCLVKKLFCVGILNEMDEDSMILQISYCMMLFEFGFDMTSLVVYLDLENSYEDTALTKINMLENYRFLHLKKLHKVKKKLEMMEQIVTKLQADD